MGDENGKKDIVVVYGRKEKKRLMQSLMRIGYVPLFQNTLRGLLDHVRRAVAAAVVLNGEHEEEADALEALLNIRDVDDDMPVLVLRETTGQKMELFFASQPRVGMLDPPLTEEALAEELGSLTAS